MRIVVENVQSTVIIGGSDNLLPYDIMVQLKGYLKVRPDGYQYAPAYRKRQWNGWRYFITDRGVFATGFLPLVVKYLSDFEGLEIEIEDKRTNVPKMNDELDLVLPNGWGIRAYQADMIRRVNNAAVGLYFPRGIIDAATNAGKNSICAGLFNNVHNPKLLFLLHSKAIFRQAVEFFGEMFPTEIGQIGDGKFKINNFTVAMVKTLYNNCVKSLNVRKSMKDFNMLIVDECFVAGTLVDGKPIEDLKINDYVNSFNHNTGSLELKKIVNVFKKVSNNLVKVTFSNGKKLVVTPEHEFWSVGDKKYLPVKNLLYGFVLDIEKGLKQFNNVVFGVVRVDSIKVYKQRSYKRFRWFSKKSYVYNIEVADNNNYFVDGILVHNCHRAGGTEYSKLLQMVDAGMRVFVSGTPLSNVGKVNNMVIVGLSGPTLGRVSNKELIEKEHSLRPKVKIFLNVTPSQAFDYAQELKDVVHNSKTRAKMIADMCIKRDGKQILVCFIEIKHGLFMKKAISEHPDFYGRVEMVHGKDAGKFYKIDDFKKGKIDVLLTSTILKEGVNIPNIEVLIMAQAGKSIITVKQFVGRALRTDGKNVEVEIIDFYDVGRYASLHSRKRLKIYRDEGFDVELDYAEIRNKPVKYMQY